VTGAATAEARFRQRRSQGRRRATLGVLLFLLAFIVALQVGEVDPQRLAAGLPRIAEYFGRTMPSLSPGSFWADLAEWQWNFSAWLSLLLDTLLIAYVGTVLGAALALLLSFPAAAPLAPHPWLAFAARRLAEFMRTVPTLVFALIFVFAFGLGPFSGALAIAIHTAGALGKLFAEVNENVDLRPLDAIAATGGTWAERMRFAVVPQALPGYLSYSLLRLEINVREASVLGLVGAGGIGEELYVAVRQFEYPDISAILVLILLTVTLMDLLCERLRHAVIGRENLRAA
jgi:phosphonate transport system permease protein